MRYAIDARLLRALLLGLLALSCSSWNVLAGTHCHKKAVASVHTRYYLYDPTPHSVRTRDDHELCYLPSEGCDNNHTITN